MGRCKDAKKIFCAGLILWMCIGLITGCGKRFDAQGYVQACLDALYLGEYDAYAQMLDMTVDEAEENMTSDMKATIRTAFEGDTVTPEEDKEAYVDAVRDIYTLAKYEVTGSEKGDGEYLVTLKAWPSNVFQNMNEAVNVRYEQAVEEKTYEESKWVSYVTEYLREAADMNEYSDAVTLEIHVKKNDGNVYSIPPEDLETIEEALFPGE